MPEAIDNALIDTPYSGMADGLKNVSSLDFRRINVICHSEVLSNPLLNRQTGSVAITDVVSNLWLSKHRWEQMAMFVCGGSTSLCRLAGLSDTYGYLS